MIKLSQESIDLIIESSDLILGPCSVLNLLDFIDDIGCNLLSPFLAFVQIVYFSDVPQTSWTLFLLLINKSPLHGPPSV